MSSFKEMVASDNVDVFLNLDEFGVKRTIIYDGETYPDIPIIISGYTEKERRQLAADHVQGLYQVTQVLHCAIDAFSGIQPEKGSSIKINTSEGSKFFLKFYIVTSTCEMGMLRMELRAIDE